MVFKVNFAFHQRVACVVAHLNLAVGFCFQFLGRRLRSIIYFHVQLLIDRCLVFSYLVVIVIDLLIKEALGMFTNDIHGLLEFFTDLAWR